MIQQNGIVLHDVVKEMSSLYPPEKDFYLESYYRRLATHERTVFTPEELIFVLTEEAKLIILSEYANLVYNAQTKDETRDEYIEKLHGWWSRLKEFIPFLVRDLFLQEETQTCLINTRWERVKPTITEAFDQIRRLTKYDPFYG